MTQPAVTRAPVAFRIYLPIAFLCLAIAIAGFWPSFFGPLVLKATPHALSIINLHATVFTGWLLLVIIQAWLAASGRIALHMRFGKWVFVWGIVVILVGWTTGFVRFGDRLHDGDPHAGSRLFVAITDLLVFAPFLAAAWFYRRRPETHKRLIVVACTTLLIAAVHRIGFLGGPPPPWPQLMAVWLSPILLGIAYDLIRRRLIHPVYLIGIAAVLFMKWGRSWMVHTDTWADFLRWVTAFYV